MKAAREKELAMLETGRVTADTRYVRDFLAWAWKKLIVRKLHQADLPLNEQRRLQTLRELGAL